MRIVGLDTETHNGKACLITKPWAFCEPLSWEDCVDFLSLTPHMACWNVDYDAQAILKFLPSLVRDRLALIGNACYSEFRIKYVKKKFLRVWKEDRHCFTMYDLMQFYNCSLASAAVSLGVQHKKDFPKSWYSKIKEKLSDARTRKVVLDYALGDAQTLQQIIDRTVKAFKMAGLNFERPYSNASFAERYFRSNFRYRRKIEVEKMARQAYHGGRIECLQAGFFPVAYYYDIHSAYPSVIAGLVKPDGEWIYEKEIREDSIYAYIDCEINIPKTEIFGPIPIRRNSHGTGGIIYPVGKFRKVITLPEYRYLARRGFQVRIFRAWQHIWARYNFPFREIEEIYTRRKRDPQTDYALKIVMNSVYGKMAQVVTSRKRVNVVDSRSEIFDGRVWRKIEQWKNHTSFVYASEITARIRMKLIEDIPPSKVISYSTDGVFCTEPIDLPQGHGLGEWSKVEEIYNLIVVGSGVYTYLQETKKGRWKQVVRFRGFSPSIDLENMLRKAGKRHNIAMKVLRNTSLKQALGKDHGSLNVLREVRRYMNVNFDTKRNWEKEWSAAELCDRSFKSKPWVYYKPIIIRS